MFSADELRVKAEAERQRPVEAGIADGVEMAQPHDAPAFDSRLVGKRLEVLWKYCRGRAEAAPHLGDGPRDACGRRADKQAQHGHGSSGLFYFPIRSGTSISSTRGASIRVSLAPRRGMRQPDPRKAGKKRAACEDEA